VPGPHASFTMQFSETPNMTQYKWPALQTPAGHTLAVVRVSMLFWLTSRRNGVLLWLIWMSLAAGRGTTGRPGQYVLCTTLMRRRTHTETPSTVLWVRCIGLQHLRTLSRQEGLFITTAATAAATETTIETFRASNGHPRECNRGQVGQR
jgi:hypothetical protein